MDRVTIVLPVFVTVLVNSYVTYGLLLGTYYNYFDSPEFSHLNPDILELLVDASTLGNVTLILATSIWMLIKFWKKGKFVIAAPVTTGLTIVIMFILGTALPDSHSEYTKEGFKYREEIWRLGNKVDKYKKWKSIEPLNKVGSGKKIVWKLDSLSDN